MISKDYGTHVIPAIHAIHAAFAQRDELWGVLNAIRVALKFNHPGLVKELWKLIPRIEELLNRPQS